MMNLSNATPLPIKVEGVEFTVTWQDFGSYIRLNAFQNGKVFGSKNFPLTVEIDQRIISYAIKSIMRAKANEAIQSQ